MVDRSKAKKHRHFQSFKGIITGKVFNSLSQSKIISVGAGAGANSPIIPDNDANAGHIPIRPGPSSSSSHIPIASGSGIRTISRVPVGPSCCSSTKYCELLTDVLQDINKFQSYASTMSTASENLLNIGIHRASTFNMLHEAAILKETTGTLSLKGKSAEQILSVMKNTSLELNQLKELPVLL